jgi:hypothetical protein
MKWIIIIWICLANMVYSSYKPYYKIIWHDCVLCRQLLRDLDTNRINYTFLASGYKDTFETRYVDIVNPPIFLKDNNFIGRDLFEFYREFM